MKGDDLIQVAAQDETVANTSGNGFVDGAAGLPEGRRLNIRALRF